MQTHVREFIALYYSNTVLSLNLLQCVNVMQIIVSIENNPTILLGSETKTSLGLKIANSSNLFTGITFIP